MKDENDQASGPSDKKVEKKGFFTEKLSWWQILLGVALVAYLTYGKYQETVTQANNPKTTAPAPAK